MPHFPDPDAFFRESLRVLRPSGRFVFSVWAIPVHSKGFEMVYDALGRHGSLDVGLPPGPNFFLHADAETSRRSLVAAGFDAVSTTVVPQTWELAEADDLLDSILHGTVRAGAVLKRQPPEVLARIRESVREAMADYSVGDGYRVPMPACLVSGTAPQAR